MRQRVGCSQIVHAELMGQVINVLLLDDHKIFVNGLAGLLQWDTDIRIIGEFFNGEEALDFVRESIRRDVPVDVALVDLRIRNSMGGLEFSLRLRKISPQTKVLILSMSDDPDDISAAILLGVAGYILKNQDLNDVRQAIHGVMRDNRPYYTQDVLQAFAGQYRQTMPEELRQLTPREIEVIKLIAQEYTTAEIAEKLFISEATVDTHRRNAIQKLRVKTIAGLIHFAIRHGLI